MKKMNEMEILLRNIKSRRKEKGLTQQELGELIGKDSGEISKIERGERRISLEQLYIISEALDCSILSLLPDNRAYENSGLDESVIEYLKNSTEKDKIFIERFIKLYLDSHN